MQSDLDSRMAKKQFYKRAVGFLIRFFDDVIEIADGLMRVDYQRQNNFVQQATLSRTQRRFNAATFA